MACGCKSESGLKRSDFNESLKRRFTEKCGEPDERGCIPWLGTRTKNGYGVATVAGTRRTTAHRIAYVLAHGDLAPAQIALHSCDNPWCVNSDHLSAGSAKENTEDMVAKGRHAWRNGTPWQKLSTAEVTRIRVMRSLGATQQSIADSFGVSRPLISLIEHGHVHSAHA